MPLRRLLAAGAAAAIALLLPSPALAATAATSSVAAEQLLVDLVNQRRAEVGQPAVTPRGDLHATARAWSFAQAEQDQLAHNDGLAGAVCCWTRLTENVAQVAGADGTDPTAVAVALYRLWRTSTPSHDRNMTDPAVDQIGVGVVIDDDGTAWGTTVFRACDGSACDGGSQAPAGDTTVRWAPAPAPSPSPTPEPAPSPSPAASPEPAPAPEPSPQPEPTATTTPVPEPTQDAASGPVPEPTPSPTPSPSPAPTPTPSPSPSAPSATSSAAASPSPSPADVVPTSPDEPPRVLSTAATDPAPDDDGPGTGALLVLVVSMLSIGATVAVRD